MPQYIILVTGAGTGIGQQSVEALAQAGHTVYASLRDVAGRNASRATALRDFAVRHGCDVRVVELDVKSQGSVDAAVKGILEEQDRIDVVVQGPYEATKAAMDSLAQATRYEVSRWGIDVVILTPGAIMTGTEHFDKGIGAADATIAAAYDRIADIGAQISRRLVELSPGGSDATAVGEAVARLVGLPSGTRPFRTMVDFLHDGAEEVNVVAEAMQARLMERLGLGDMLRPHGA